MKTNLFNVRKNLNISIIEKYRKSQFLFIKFYLKRFDTGLWKIFKNNKKTYFLHVDVLIKVILMRLKFMLKPEFLYTSGLIINLKGFNRYKDKDPEAKDLDLRLKIALEENIDLNSFMEKINSHLVLDKDVNPHSEQYYFSKITVKVFLHHRKCQIYLEMNLSLVC